ncbi:MAG: ABC transporter permease, partial [Betaproteobacteria bacterium]|nr:ABC transporter permease [Betaproteobacteria bacterium]
MMAYLVGLPWPLAKRLTIEQLRLYRYRNLLAAVVIGVGVAMGLAIDLVNRSALKEFRSALASVNGNADASLRATDNDLSASVFATLIADPRVAGAAPVLLERALIESMHNPESQAALIRLDADFSQSLEVYGIDLFRSIALHPTLSPAMRGAEESEAWFGSNRLYASPRLWQQIESLGMKPEEEAERMSNLSRAYRVNLAILALVALLTGVFIVQSNMQLISARQWTTLALLQVLGSETQAIQAFMRFQALLIGLAGSFLGLVIGSFAAWVLLTWTSGDLGAGLLKTGSKSLELPIPLLAFHAALGLLVAWLGSWLAVRSLGRISAVSAIKGGHPPPWFSSRQLLLSAVGLGGFGGLCLLLKPIQGVPVGAYLCLVSWLLGGLLCMPSLVAYLAQSLSRLGRLHPLSWLALERAKHVPQSISLSMTGMLASVALCVAVSLMISSFRLAVTEWLDHVLPADVYARVQRAESKLSAEQQAQLAQLPLVRRTEFQQVLEWMVVPERPTVAVIVRDLPLKTPQDRLPITGELFDPHPTLPSVWVSEAMRDLYAWQPGSVQKLSLLPEPSVFVAGVWRDYARQHGSIIVETSQWMKARRAGEALEATDVSWWLTESDSRAEDLIAHIPLALADKLEIRSASAIRSLSLRIFDRSFLVTYALQAVALGIGLLGVTSTLAAQALARTQELAALQLLGLSPGSVSYT